jgi:hypothetical protein
MDQGDEATAETTATVGTVYMTASAAMLTLRALNTPEVEKTPVETVPEETTPEETTPEEDPAPTDTDTGIIKKLVELIGKLIDKLFGWLFN